METMIITLKHQHANARMPADWMPAGMVAPIPAAPQIPAAQIPAAQRPDLLSAACMTVLAPVESKPAWLSATRLESGDGMTAGMLSRIPTAASNQPKFIARRVAAKLIPAGKQAAVSKSR